MRRRQNSTGWRDVEWPEGTDYGELARMPSSLEKVWDAYEAVSGAQGRCTASKQLAKKRGNLIQRSAHQYDLYLRRSEDGVTIDKVEERVKVHPYVAKLTIKYNDYKLINTSASDHESSYNLRFATDDGFFVTMGYTRHGDNEDGVTHLWVECSTKLAQHYRRRLQRLLANLGGYLGPYDGQPVAPGVDSQSSSSMSAGQLVAPEPEQQDPEQEAEQQVKLSVLSQSSFPREKADSEQETDNTMELSALLVAIARSPMEVLFGPARDQEDVESVCMEEQSEYNRYAGILREIRRLNHVQKRFCYII